MVGTRSRKTRPDTNLGQILSSAREARRLSQRDVAIALNMTERQLQALEEGDFSIFSAEIYARGACMRYATYLGIESEASERAIWRALSGAREAVPLKVHTAFSWFERTSSPRTMIWAVLSVVMLIVGGYIAWQVKSFWQLPQLSLDTTVPTVASDQYVSVQGKTEAGTKVTVNGEQIVLQPDASWHMDMRLHPGINVVYIEAQNAAGRKRVLERDILWPRDGAVAAQDKSP